MNLLVTEVATDWSAIWSITLVSFGLVLVILLLLVFAMMVFGLFFKKGDKASTTAKAAAEVKNVSGNEEEVVAAIGVAVALAQGALHIEEPGYLTFTAERQTAWNNKAYGITRMPEHIH